MAYKDNELSQDDIKDKNYHIIDAENNEICIKGSKQKAKDGYLCFFINKINEETFKNKTTIFFLEQTGTKELTECTCNWSIYKILLKIIEQKDKK